MVMRNEKAINMFNSKVSKLQVYQAVYLVEEPLCHLVVSVGRGDYRSMNSL
jgi:hypothetical protein